MEVVDKVNEAMEATNHIKEEIVEFVEAPFQGFMTGAWTAATGLLHSLRNKKVIDSYSKFFRGMGIFLLAIYSIGGILLLSFLPIAAAIFLYAPGTLYQLLITVPLWAYLLAKRWSPMTNDEMFINELEALDPQLASRIRTKVAEYHRGLTHQSWFQGVKNSTRSWWHFTWLSFVFSSFSIVPLLGSLFSFLGQVLLVGESLGWNLMNVYTIAYKEMDYKSQKKWMEGRIWSLWGFCIPFALLFSIPFVGPLFIGFSQAAAAHLFYYVFCKSPPQQKPSAMMKTILSNNIGKKLEKTL